MKIVMTGQTMELDVILDVRQAEIQTYIAMEEVGLQ